MPVKIFFCYAHEDEALLNKLKTHLRPLQRQGLIDPWHDRDISAGAEWEKEISEQLNAAQIILLLISPDFMDSEYCYSIKMKRAMERHERREAIVIPVILRPVYWQGALFGKLTALPTDAKPIVSSVWHNLDEAFLDVAKGIKQLVHEYLPNQSGQHEQQATNPSTNFEPKSIPTLQEFDTGKQRDHKLYAECLERWARDIDLDNWMDWTSRWIFISPRPKISYKQLDTFEDLDIWLNSRVWPKRYPELDAAFENFRRVLFDLVSVHYRHSTTDDAHKYSVTDKYYQSFSYSSDGRRLKSEEEQLKEYELHLELLGDLMLELTRAANYICDKVREFIDPTFRIREGVVLVAFNTGEFRRTEYQNNERVLFPYPGLEQFMKERKDRDLTF